MNERPNDRPTVGELEVGDVIKPKVSLDTLFLGRGDHYTPDRGLCLMEAVAYFRGIPHTDAPPCVSPVLRDFGIHLNDSFGDEKRQKLKPFITRLPGTARDGHDETRAHLALDWLIRTAVPAWLDLAGLTARAAELRDLAPITDCDSAALAALPVQQSLGEAWDTEAATEGLGDYALADRAVTDAPEGAHDLACRFIPTNFEAAGGGHAYQIIDRCALRVTRSDPAAVERAIGEVQDSALELFGRMVTAGGAK